VIRLRFDNKTEPYFDKYLMLSKSMFAAVLWTNCQYWLFESFEKEMALLVVGECVGIFLSFDMICMKREKLMN
jgi:hypothetical protein